MKINKKKLSILFIGKKNDAYCKKAIKFIKKHFQVYRILVGRRGDSFPSKINLWKGDYIISYLSPWIIKESLLKRTKIASINFHPGPPEYPGIGCTNFAIYNRAKVFGVTCHHMNQKVDTGKIIMVDSFPITKVETVDSLSKKTYKKLLSIFKKTMKLFFKEKILIEEKIKWKRKPYKRKQLNTLANLNINMNKNEFSRRLRAIYYSDYLSPTIIIHGHKFRYEKSKK